MNTPLNNNCSTCNHKKHPDGGHCYMFRTEPQWQCQQHTELRSFSHRALRKIMLAVIPQVGGTQ